MINRILQNIILEMYTGKITREDIESVACEKCPYRVEGKCPIPGPYPCLLDDEAIVNSYLRSEVNERLGYDESMNELLRECGFEE